MLVEKARSPLKAAGRLLWLTLPVSLHRPQEASVAQAESLAALVKCPPRQRSQYSCSNQKKPSSVFLLEQGFAPERLPEPAPLGPERLQAQAFNELGGSSRHAVRSVGRLSD